MAFATEPVFASLANVLGSTDNAPSPLPSELKDYQLYDVEIKYGLLQVSQDASYIEPVEGDMVRWSYRDVSDITYIHTGFKFVFEF